MKIKEIIKLIEQNSKEDDYKKFLKNADYSFENGVVTISVKSVMIARFLKTTYYNKFVLAFKDELGEDIECVFTNKEIKIKQPKIINKEKEKEKEIDFVFNDSYSFDSFVVGSSNQIAYGASKAVAENLARQYNPLFIYGPTGLGKTHLLLAIGNEAKKKNKKVLYLTSEQFLNEFTFSLSTKNVNNFQKKYRSCDVLLIDDIQFFSGKEATQEEFFHTFNELHTNNKQIVITADKAPNAIIGLEERLKSRFEWGLCVDIKNPELETKIAIIRKKCEINKIDLSQEMVEYIANHLNSSIRQIEGFLFTLNANASIIHTKITLELIQNLIQEYIKEEKNNVDSNDIIKAVCEEFNVKASELKSSSKVKKIVGARRCAIFLLKELTHNSMPVIAKLLNMQDHSSVSKNVKKTNELIKQNAEFKNQIENLKNRILHN